MKRKLRPMLHYRLMLLSRGPCFYAESFEEILLLQKSELIEQTGVISADGSREWAIIDAGRIALQVHAKGNV